MLKLGVAYHTLHQPLAQAQPTIRFQDKHIGNIGKGGVVSHHARKAYLFFTLKESKVQRVIESLAHDLTGHTH